jgi:hypothetical protein
MVDMAGPKGFLVLWCAGMMPVDASVLWTGDRRNSSLGEPLYS